MTLQQFFIPSELLIHYKSDLLSENELIEIKKSNNYINTKNRKS